MPAEVYVFGTQYWTVVIAILLMSIGCGVFFLPVFYKLQLNTSYEVRENSLTGEAELCNRLRSHASHVAYLGPSAGAKTQFFSKLIIKTTFSTGKNFGIESNLILGLPK